MRFSCLDQGFPQNRDSSGCGGDMGGGGAIPRDDWGQPPYPSGLALKAEIIK